MMSEPFQLLTSMAFDSTIDWDYFKHNRLGLLSFYLTIFHAFCEMLSHIFYKKGNIPNHLVVSLLSTIHILINTCKRPYAVSLLMSL